MNNGLHLYQHSLNVLFEKVNIVGGSMTEHRDTHGRTYL